jgi:hypothetical protein
MCRIDTSPADLDRIEAEQSNRRRGREPQAMIAFSARLEGNPNRSFLNEIKVLGPALCEGPG